MKEIHMKRLICICCLFISICAFAQESKEIKKLQSVLEKAQKLSDFKSVIDGDIVAGICGLVGGSTFICGLLEAPELNQNEEKELEAIRSKIEFENLLRSRGINPDDFYKKLYEERWNPKIQDRFDFLKVERSPASTSGKSGISAFHDCFSIVKVDRGTVCGSSSSIAVVWKNNCAGAMDIKFALQREDGKWSTGLQSNVAAGESTNAGAWTCKSTGKYLWWARPAEKWMEYKFPKDEEIKLDN